MTTLTEPQYRSQLAPVGVAAFLWCLGAALTPWLGVWGGVGGAALLLGTSFAVLYAKTLAPLWRVRRTYVMQGLLAGIVMIAATYLLFPLVGRLVPTVLAHTRELYRLFNSGPAVVRLLLPFVIVGEELVWRGLVQSVVARRLGAAAGVVVTALAYALCHAPVGAPLLSGVALCCGLYWGFVRARTDSLIPSVLAHLMWDLVVMVCFPLAG